MRRWQKWGLAFVSVPLVLLAAWDRTRIVRWVGSTELEVVFVVWREGTELPVSGARVEVVPETRPLDGPERNGFALDVDGDGVARKLCPETTCAGVESGLKITNTYSVRLPSWRFRAVAPEYEPSEWAELNKSDYWHQVQRIDSQRNRLLVWIKLKKQ